MVDFLYLLGILLGPFFVLFSFYSLFTTVRDNYNKKSFYISSSAFLFILVVIINTSSSHEISSNCNFLSSEQLILIQKSKNHKITCLEKDGKGIVLYGESHAKTELAWSEGNLTIQAFDEVALETSNLDGIPSWIADLAWKERSVLNFFAYKIVGLRESSRDTAKKTKEIIDLESHPHISQFEEEYQKDTNIFKDYVITKRNLRIKYNIIKNLKPHRPMLVIVGKNHVKGLNKLLKADGFK